MTKTETATLDDVVIRETKARERQRLLALALAECQRMGKEVTGEVYDALDEAIALEFAHMRI